MQLLKKLYRIYSPSGKEKRLREFIKDYVRTIPDTEYYQDKAGNLYVTKGTAETYPCIAAHLDQVQYIHSKDFTAIETRDIIFGYSPKNRRFEGLGADDKNGIWVALCCLKKYPKLKCVFFVQEETGCRGSSQAEMKFFEDTRFVIQCDRQGHSDLINNISGTELCSSAFTLDMDYGKFGYSIQEGMLTDVLTLKEQELAVSCVNVSCGYYKPHTDNEYTVKKDLLNCLKFVGHIIENLTETYPHKYESPVKQNFNFFKRFKVLDVHDRQVEELKEDIWEFIDFDRCITAQDLFEMYQTNYPLLGLEDFEKVWKEYMTLNFGS